jgi:hypothetical protein
MQGFRGGFEGHTKETFILNAFQDALFTLDGFSSG